MPGEGATSPRPRVLVFSTNTISDMGVDFAGSSHMDYPSSVEVIAVPCSGGINPQWILHALKVGFAGVFVAADGPECFYLSDCVARTAKVVAQAQELLRANGIDPSRVKTAAICSTCAEPFVNHMKAFTKALSDLSSTVTATAAPVGAA